MAELDIFQDTTADVAFADTTAMAAEEQTERLYDYTNQRESGGSQNLYWGNHSRQVTAAELQELYNADDNARLREAFKTFDNYLAYMNERQDLIDSGEYKADWWNTGVPLVSEETLADPEAGMDDRAFERQVIEEGARQGQLGYEAQQDVFSALYEKYTGEPVIKYLDNGAKYEWNGTSFVLTQEAFGPHFGSIVGGVVATAILSGAATAGIAGAIAQIPGVSTTLANNIANVAVSAMTGQDLDPADALSFAFNTLLPGSGEVIEEGVIENAIDQIVGVLTDPDNYMANPDKNPEDDWGTIDYEGIEGEFDPDDPNNSYDPDLIDPQLIIFPEEEAAGGGGATGEEPVEETPVPEEQPPEDIFVYDPEHDFIYRGNGVFEQVGEDGKPTGTVYEDPDFTNEDEYPAVVDEAYSIPGTSGAEGPIEPTQEGITVPDVNIIVPPSTGQTPTDSTDVTDGVEDVGQAQGEEGTGAEGAGVEGVGDDGTGEGEGGDGEGEGEGEDGEEQAPEESSLFAMARYEPTRPVGVGYELPEIPPLIEALQIDWTSSLDGLENRLQQDKLQQRNPSLFDGMV